MFRIGKPVDMENRSVIAGEEEVKRKQEEGGKWGATFNG